MKRTVWQWLAVSSILVLFGAQAETRPQYGGTLHVEMRASMLSLDPADASADSFGRRGVISLLYDTLVSWDESGHLKPTLAESWQSSRGDQRWELHLRPGVKFQDGTPLTGEVAAASLRTANPSWNVSADANAVVIQLEAADPQLLAELALPRNAIAKRGKDPVGTGAFEVANWQPGKKLTLRANEECWRGRPFLDGVEIEMGQSFRDQATAFALHKAELIEVAPEQTHRMLQEERPLTSAAKIELLALVFRRDASTAEEKLLRQALVLSVDRAPIRSVLLQGAGEPTASVLPTWISGYGFVFSPDNDLAKARQLRSQVGANAAWTIGYDNTDALTRLVAERVALNTSDAGLSLRPTSANDTDLRVVRIPMASADPWVAFDEALKEAALASGKITGRSLEDLYTLEQTTLGSERVLPLLHLPASYAAADLKDWRLRVDGSWNLDAAWLEAPKP